MRIFRQFSYKQAHYRISSCGFDAAAEKIIEQRKILENFIRHFSEFKTAMEPLNFLPGNAPDIAGLMHEAAKAAGVGPMAAVAGSFAQKAVEAAIISGCSESIVENGGDIFLHLDNELILGIYAGNTPLGRNLAFKIPSSITPLAVCSSSSTMGHSVSLGKCDLATVFSHSGALADAAATFACNLVREEKDIAPTVERIMEIKGVLGILMIKNDKVGLGGEIPELVQNSDPGMLHNVTRDENSNFIVK